jgi:hypothetical protein
MAFLGQFVAFSFYVVPAFVGAGFLCWHHRLVRHGHGQAAVAEVLEPRGVAVI